MAVHEVRAVAASDDRIPDELVVAGIPDDHVAASDDLVVPHLRVPGLPETNPITSKAERPFVGALHEVVENLCAIGLLDEQPEHRVLHAHALYPNVIRHDVDCGIQGIEATPARRRSDR
jgi:hypothetical protein